MFALLFVFLSCFCERPDFGILFAADVRLSPTEQTVHKCDQTAEEVTQRTHEGTGGLYCRPLLLF